ncbi:hypothetical protein GCM10010353_50730 [Streptomyces chryseus]|nr:hypothetical protein GCM10010353_50730 [Streptomyces chryseus]
MHESGVPCQLDIVRFMPVQARQPSRATGSAYGSSPFARFVPEVGFPVRSYKRGAFGAVSPGSVAASADRLVHPLSEVVHNCVGGGVREGGFPWGGTGSKVSARRAGARGVVCAERTLSTDRLVQGRRMDHEARVLPAEGGVRFGVYTGPMTQATLGCSARVVPAALVGAVGR